MSRTFGFIALILAMGIGLYVLSLHMKSVSSVTDGHPKATVEITGVKNDLMAIAHAERRYMATNGKYVSLGELISSGELSMPSTSRVGYTYSVEVTGSGFVATASSDNPPAGAPTVLHVDEQMRVTQE